VSNHGPLFLATDHRLFHLSRCRFPGEELFSHLYSAVQSTLAPSCGPRIYIPRKPLEMSLDARHRGHHDLPAAVVYNFLAEKLESDREARARSQS